MSQVADKFGEAFKKDRSEFSGRSSTPSGCEPRCRSCATRPTRQLSLAEAMLADGRRFVLGGEPSLADCALYNPVWFIQQHLGAAAARSTGCPGSSPGRSA